MAKGTINQLQTDNRGEKGKINAKTLLFLKDQSNSALCMKQSGSFSAIYSQSICFTAKWKEKKEKNNKKMEAPSAANWILFCFVFRTTIM